MNLLAQASGVALFEDGACVLVVERGTRALYTVAFVLALATLILGINGVVLLALAATDGEVPWVAGVAISGVALGAGLALRSTVQSVRRRHAATPGPQDASFVFDLGRRELLDGGGRTIAPLGAIKVSRRLQLGSSSPALVVNVAGGPTLVLARGNPFAGGIAPLEEVLRQRKLMP